MTERRRIPDKKKALSLLEASKKDMQFTLTIKPSKASSATIVRNIYENFRMIGEAILVFKGIEHQDHDMPIKELLSLNADTKRPINLIENLRTIRHNINYRGYLPTLSEAQDAISIAEACFDPVLEEAHRIINA